MKKYTNNYRMDGLSTVNVFISLNKDDNFLTEDFLHSNKKAMTLISDQHFYSY